MEEKLKRAKFLAARADGLGERLKAILNAIYFSQLFDCKYKIAWPLRNKMQGNTFHDITAPNELFDEVFIKENFIEEEELAKKTIFDVSIQGPVGKSFIVNNITSFDFFKIQQANPKKYIKDLPGRKQDFKTSFDSIRFSKSIKRIIEYTDSLSLDIETVAVHIRGGDIVYGEYRSSQAFYQKLIPLSYVKPLVDKLSVQGKSALVFIHDKKLVSFLEKQNIRSAEQYSLEGWSTLEKTFFELYLMSKCKKIICGTSGFASVASKISGIDIDNIESYLSFEDKASALQKTIFGSTLDNYQKAMACNTYLLLYEKFIDASDIDFYLNLAAKFDPGNTLYKVKSIYNNVKMRKLDLSESIAQDVISNNVPDFNQKIMLKLFINPLLKPDLRYYTEDFLNSDLSQYKYLKAIKELIIDYLK